MIIREVTQLKRLLCFPFLIFGIFMCCTSVITLMRGKHISECIAFLALGIIFSIVGWIHIHCDYAEIDKEKVTIYQARWFGYNTKVILSDEISEIKLVDALIPRRHGRSSPGKEVVLVTTTEERFLLREANSENTQIALLERIENILI